MRRIFFLSLLFILVLVSCESQNNYKLFYSVNFELSQDSEEIMNQFREYETLNSDSESYYMVKVSIELLNKSKVDFSNIKLDIEKPKNVIEVSEGIDSPTTTLGSNKTAIIEHSLLINDSFDNAKSFLASLKYRIIGNYGETKYQVNISTFSN
jgi:hypothetical protein